MRAKSIPLKHLSKNFFILDEKITTLEEEGTSKRISFFFRTHPKSTFTLEEKMTSFEEKINSLEVPPKEFRLFQNTSMFEEKLPPLRYHQKNFFFPRPLKLQPLRKNLLCWGIF